ncbi:PfkB family carbohydrate kinase [Subtercola frigoramans]|uniref:Sugar/nucleoside kinase (Ribokinase family) n=1 Tax=Subtercola frigoramans TaxID=120298 RepID=A0ABS2L205_9MICO|nr:PfkB family carbohydrate kinase [Subtercola frigoramans]MBM7471105.1 sugar/nucleoside kinase (ribokinase family) [Subtercola frigoramans]
MDLLSATLSPSVTIVGHVCIDENRADDDSAVDEPNVDSLGRGGSGDGTNASSGSGETRRSAGSPAVFMAPQFSRNSVDDVSVLAPYADDFPSLGAGLDFLNPPQAGTTMLYRNIIEGGLRRQECQASAAAEPVPLNEAISARLASTDILVVAPLLPTFTADYVRQLAGGVPSHAVTILIAQGYLRDVTDDAVVVKRAFSEHAEILPLFDLVVFSDEDISDALVVARNWSGLYPRVRFVVTQNSAGATIFSAGSATHVAAHPIDTVGQAIGTGDVFSAEFALSYFHSGDAVAAVAEANVAAADFIVRSAVRAAAV